MKYRDVPVVFLSYREDNAEANFSDLQQHVPDALRVKGVKGFDAAHKAAAKAARGLTDRPQDMPPFFITVDGDNRTSSEFWELDVSDTYGAVRKLLGSDVDWHTAEWVLSWNAYNPVTGLAYGNGGLKAWSYAFVDNMSTHEDAQESVVDFCWRPGYVQLSKIFSTTHINASPRQAYTAGFREGVKMPLVQGGKMHGSIYETANRSYGTNLERLITWCSVGQHMENGIWSVFGALDGFVQCHIRKTFDVVNVSDIMTVHERFLEMQKYAQGGMQMTDTILHLRSEVENYTGLQIPALGPKQSTFVVERTRPFLQLEPFAAETWPPKYLAPKL